MYELTVWPQYNRAVPYDEHILHIYFERKRCAGATLPKGVEMAGFERSALRTAWTYDDVI